jgi:hypothetical protein
MLSTKIRTAILTLAVTAGVAAAPAVSQAQINNPGAHAATCEVYRLTWNLLNEAQENAERNGQKDLAAYYEREKNNSFAYARTEGCAWSKLTGESVPGQHAPVAKAKPIGSIAPTAARR